MRQGKILEKYRKRSGLSRLDLATMMDVHYQFIYNTEIGKNKIPKKWLKFLIYSLGIDKQEIINAICLDVRSELISHLQKKDPLRLLRGG